MKVYAMTNSIKRKAIIKILFLFLLLPFVNLQAQSYEGNMYGKIKEREVDLFIWLDLKIAKDNKILNGSYFYKTIGKEISISGKKNGNKISLIEKDKNKNITGVFKLTVLNGNIKGVWYQPNKKDTLQVELYRANPALRNTAKIPKLNDLLSEEITF